MGINTPFSLLADGHTSIVQSDTVNITKPDGSVLPGGCAVLVMAVGHVALVDSFGVARTYTISAVPYAIPVRVKRVNDTGTDIADADMMGLY